MGQNTQGVAYNFGQMGSMLVTGTDAFYPPKGRVIVAITSLSDDTDFNSTNGLISELDENGNSNWVSADADAHGTGISAAQNAHNANGGNATGVITLTGADDKIKVGMIVENATMCPRSLTDPYVVKSISGTALTVAKKSNPRTAAAVAGDVAAAGTGIHFFRDGGQGFGGIELSDATQIPIGVTIYGRWTGGKLAAGKIIAYFGV